MTGHARPGSILRTARPLLRALNRQSGVSLFLAVLCIITGAGLAAAAPLLLARLVDSLSEGAPSAALLVCLYAGSLGLVRITAEGRAFFYGRAEQDIVRTLSLSVVRHTLSLPLAFVQARSPGALVQILENGLQGYRLLLQHGVFTLLPGLLEITLIAVIIASELDLAFLVVFTLCGLLYALVFGVGAARVLLASRDVSAARIDVTARLADAFVNIETVKALSGEGVILTRMDQSLGEVRQSWRRFYSVRGTLTSSLSGTRRAATGLIRPAEFTLSIMTPKVIPFATLMNSAVCPRQNLTGVNASPGEPIPKATMTRSSTTRAIMSRS